MSNPYGLPPEVLAQLQPVATTDGDEGAPEPLYEAPDAARVHEVAAKNLAACAGFELEPWEQRWTERTLALCERYVFHRARELAGITDGFSRANIAAYNAFERNFENAGRVA